MTKIVDNCIYVPQPSIQDFFETPKYLKSKIYEEELYKKGFKYEHRKDLHEYLKTFDLCLFYIVNHMFDKEDSKRICEALINIKDENELKKVMYELTICNGWFATNCYPEEVIFMLKVANGAVYSPFLKMISIISRDINAFHEREPFLEDERYSFVPLFDDSYLYLDDKSDKVVTKTVREKEVLIYCKKGEDLLKQIDAYAIQTKTPDEEIVGAYKSLLNIYSNLPLKRGDEEKRLIR